MVVTLKSSDFQSVDKIYGEQTMQKILIIAVTLCVIQANPFIESDELIPDIGTYQLIIDNNSSKLLLDTRTGQLYVEDICQRISDSLWVFCWTEERKFVPYITSTNHEDYLKFIKETKKE